MGGCVGGSAWREQGLRALHWMLPAGQEDLEDAACQDVQ